MAPAEDSAFVGASAELALPPMMQPPPLPPLLPPPPMMSQPAPPPAPTPQFLPDTIRIKSPERECYVRVATECLPTEFGFCEVSDYSYESCDCKDYGKRVCTNVCAGEDNECTIRRDCETYFCAFMY